MPAAGARNAPLCPSAPSDAEDARIFGVATREDGSSAVAYLDRAAPMTAELRERASPLSPEEVFRVAGRCAEARCRHFDGARCGLARRISETLDPAVSRPPRCAIRPTCRWWRERGRDACLRCPAVVTLDVAPSPKTVLAAIP